MKSAVAAVVLATAIGVAGCAELSDLVVVPSASPLDPATAADGLREALRVGAGRAVDRAAAVDGFLANELIRIVIPEELDSMASTLRRIGLDRQVDELELEMNRAAEKAAGEAREVLTAEIRKLTFPDALRLVNGGETAATDFFRQRTEAELRSRFRPIVVAKMNEVGLARLYEQLADRYDSLPFLSKPALDLDDYVTDETLDGLFTVLGEEEERIRADPVARTTELLRRVFGRSR